MELEPLVFDLDGHDGRNAVKDLLEWERNGLHGELSGLDLGEVEDVVEQPEERVGRRVDLIEIVLLSGGERGAEGELCEADDGVHRRADLVAHVGEEGALGPRCALRLLLGPLERFCEQLPLCDLSGDAEDADQFAIAVAGGRFDRLEVASVSAYREGQFLFVGAALGALHGPPVVRAEEVGQLLGDKIIVCLSDNLLFGRAEEPLEGGVAGEVDALFILEPDEVWDGSDKGAQMGLFAGEVSRRPRVFDGNARKAGSLHQEGEVVCARQAGRRAIERKGSDDLACCREDGLRPGRADACPLHQLTVARPAWMGGELLHDHLPARSCCQRA